MTNSEQSSSLDPVTLEMINGALVAACREMGLTMTRTAYSPVFYEGTDYSTGIFDPKIRHVAQAEGCPSQLGALSTMAEWSIKEIGFDDLQDGDVIITNDSYRGGTHLPEFLMIKPIFYEDSLIGFAGNIAHHVDVGGMAPGGFPGTATEIYQEGIIVPPVKMFRRGEEVKEVWKIVLSNVRTAKNSYGDFKAMYGSLVTAETRIRDLAKKYGVGTYLNYLEAIMDHAERLMRKEIQKIPTGKYAAEEYVEDDGVTDDMYTIRCTVTVDRDKMEVDFSGSDRQAKGPVNAPYGVTRSATYNAIFNLVDPEMPHNYGSFRPVRIIAPPGTIVNVDFPGPLNGGQTETHNLIVNAVLKALAQAMPEKVGGAEGGTCLLLTAGGLGLNGEPYVFCIWDGVGWGAREGKDGNNAIVTYCGGHSHNYLTETIENEYPWRINTYELREDSGGFGKYRGGLGVVREYELLGKESRVSAHGNRCKVLPNGLIGGGPGGPSQYLIWKAPGGAYRSPIETSPELKSPTKFSNMIFREADKIKLLTPGGGGYGNPRERDMSLVEEDLINGYISLETAVQIYGLSMDRAKQLVAKYWYPYG